MAARIIPVQSFDLVIFGITGDLSFRKLIPALYSRFVDGQIPEKFRIIGLARSELDDEKLRFLVRDSLEKYASRLHFNESKITTFLEHFFYVKNNVTNQDSWEILINVLNAGRNEIRVFYLAVSPSLFGTIATQIQHFGLADDSRIVIEKPFGHDLESAQKLAASIGDVFTESSIYRIDHYLGKETVQNLMALRFANSLFEPLWNSRYIDHIQITAAETIGIEGRGAYYDKSGAMRDMVQNHLMQLLCLTAMEAPYSFDADAIRDEKLKVLKALKPMQDDAAIVDTVRGQYYGATDSQGYLEDIEQSASNTESFVAFKAEIDNWRWAGTPFYLRTGKRLSQKVMEIFISFRELPHSIFGKLDTKMVRNGLVIRLQPDDGLLLSIMTKDPGPGGFRLRETNLDMTFITNGDQEQHSPDAYERLLMDVVRGDQTLFMRDDEVEAAWQWIDPIINAWKKIDHRPHAYESFSSGPRAADQFIEKDNRSWRKLNL